MPLLRIPAPFDPSAPATEPKVSAAQKTIGVRFPPAEVKAVKAAADAAGQSCTEWIREAVRLHLKQPARKKKPAPDPTLLTELMGLRSLVQNLITAASDLPEDTVQRIARHADSIKEGKAEEVLKRIEQAHAEGK